MDRRLIHRSQRGFTLIELLIAIGITAIITGVLTASIMQVWTVSYRTRDRMTAVRQVQQAGFWVSPDVMTAQTVTPGGCADCLLTLSWTEVTGSHTAHQIKYILVDMSGGLERLDREHYIGTNSTPDSSITVAEYINSASFVKLPNGNAYNFTVTATVGDQSETRTYEVQPRPGT
jgi:prepilin-type N-terminal cleavage/methylation domain-containing protein